MRFALLVLALAAALFVLDRLALWAESNGWIYYRRRRASPRALGNALLETQALLEPRARETIEALAARPAEAEASGDPPPAGDDGTPRGHPGRRRQGDREGEARETMHPSP